MNLKRLKMISEYIEPNDKLADVGCDHGYLAIEAIKKGVSFVQLIDNKKGPLQSAQTNLKEYEQNTELIFTLANGLFELHSQVDTVAICGMGGNLIIDILKNDFEKLKGIKKIILQANNQLYKLRSFLMMNKLEIISEKIVCENQKKYEIILVTPAENELKYSEKELLMGPILLKNSNDLPLFLSKWHERQIELAKIIEICPNSNRLKRLLFEYQLITEVLNESK